MIWALLMLIAGGAVPLAAQMDDDMPRNPEVQARVKAARVAYLTERLGLSTGESEQFWALYNEYEDEQRAVRRQYRPGKAVEQMTNEEAEVHLSAQMEKEEALLGLRRDYYSRMLKVVPARKLVLLEKADREFRLELVRKMRDRREGRGGRF